MRTSNCRTSNLAVRQLQCRFSGRDITWNLDWWLLPHAFEKIERVMIDDATWDVEQMESVAFKDESVDFRHGPGYSQACCICHLSILSWGR